MWQHVKLSEQIYPWDTLACCWDVKQASNQQTNFRAKSLCTDPPFLLRMLDGDARHSNESCCPPQSLRVTKVFVSQRGVLWPCFPPDNIMKWAVLKKVLASHQGCVTRITIRLANLELTVHFFFFYVSQLCLWGSFWVRFLHMCPFFNPTIEVVPFHLHGWCMVGVFLLPALTCLEHEYQHL